MFLIRDSTHRRVQRTWIVASNTEEKVYRGPFYGTTHQIVLEKYKCLKQLNHNLQLGLKIFIPEVILIEEKTFLEFPKLYNVEWSELTTSEKILVVKMSFIRYALVSPSNSMDDFLKYKNKLVPINLDGRKMLNSETLIELLFEKFSSHAQKLCALFHKYQKELLSFLDELETCAEICTKLNDDFVNRCTYLRERLKNKNIVRVNIPFERIEGRRGPKVGKKTKEEVKIVCYYNLPSKGTFEHASAKNVKIYSIEEISLSSDYFFNLATSVPLEVFKMHLYQFMLEYLSIKDIERYLKFAVTETDLHKIYHWITSLQKPQELFEIVLLSSINDEKLPTWEDSRIHLKSNKYLSTMAKVLPYHASYFYHLTSHWSNSKQYVWKKNENVTYDLKATKFNKDLLFRSMLQKDGEDNKDNINPHLTINSNLRKYLLKLHHYHLDFTPYNLYGIYH